MERMKSCCCCCCWPERRWSVELCEEQMTPRDWASAVHAVLSQHDTNVVISTIFPMSTAILLCVNELRVQMVRAQLFTTKARKAWHLFYLGSVPSCSGCKQHDSANWQIRPRLSAKVPNTFGQAAGDTVGNYHLGMVLYIEVIKGWGAHLLLQLHRIKSPTSNTTCSILYWLIGTQITNGT